MTYITTLKDGKLRRAKRKISLYYWKQSYTCKWYSIFANIILSLQMQYFLCKYITILLQNATLTFQKCNTIFPKKKKETVQTNSGTFHLDQGWSVSLSRLLALLNVCLCIKQQVGKVELE